MRLRLRLVLPTRAVRHEVVVVATPGATVARLRTAVAASVATDGLALHVGGDPVPDDARLGHPPLLNGATLTFSPDLPAPPATALLQLHVRSGPDTGHVFDLPPGEHVVGRSPDAPIRLDDPSVSRAHAVLQVRTREVTIRDAGSTNGTWLDGLPVGPSPLPVAAREPVRAGGTTLVVHVPGEVPASVAPDGAGHLLVNRSPRHACRPEQPAVPFPSPPPEGTAPRLSWVAAVVPLALAAVLAVVLRSATMLLFGLMSPVVLVGQWLAERRGARRSRRQALQAYADEVAAAEELLTEALARETAARRQLDPEPSLVLAIACRPQSRIWEREAAPGMRGRIGVGSLPALTGCPGHPTPCVGPVPVDVDLSGAGGLGIAGSRDAVLAAVRALVGRTAVLYSPRELHVLVVAPPEHRLDWKWTSGLPHTAADLPAGPDELLDSVGRALGERSPVHQERHGRRVLVVVDGVARWRAHPGLAGALSGGHRHGVHVLSLGDTVARLPGECHSVLDLTTDPAVLRLAGDVEPIPVTVDAVDQKWADRLAEALLPLRDAAPADSAARLPAAVSLLRLLELADVDAEVLARRWRQCPRSTVFPIGADGDGPVVVDLAADGPHVLVGGTTGSGKSELLVALVAALAAGNRPDELAFVLVDYKGGAAFAGCAELPHVVGVVTDLDAELTERALASLDAELKRRERLLGEHGCRDLTAYLANGHPQQPPLPRLVLVVDEFRSLAQDLPDFVTGLVRVASLGRSLGVHLVVATQRPAGVVTADMRANLGLRIALRVRDVADSLDVLEAPDAARIDEPLPGRGYLRSATGRLTAFQGALVTGHSRAQEGLTLVSVDDVPVDPAALPAETDLARLVEAARGAARALAIPPVPSPWLPPLPDVVAAQSLGASAGAVALGLVDDPARQAQGPYFWDLDAGPLAVTGPPRSGRTTALLTVAVQLQAMDVPVYVVHTGGLAAVQEEPLEGTDDREDTEEHDDDNAEEHDEQCDDEVEPTRGRLPQTGERSALGQPHGPRGRREPPERQRALAHVTAAVDLSDLSRLDRLVSLLGQGAPRAPARRVLLVDDWDAVAAQLLDARQPALLDALVALVRRGHQQGLRAVVAGSRAVVSGPLLGAFSQRLLLAPVDPVDLALAGLPARAASGGAPPGRAIDATTRRQVQLAVPDLTTRRGAPAARAGSARARRRSRRGTAQAVPRLPSDVSREQLTPTEGLLPVGVGFDGPVGFRVDLGHRRAAVLGDRGCGRTTSLVTLACGLVRLGFPVAMLGAARAAWPGDVLARWGACLQDVVALGADDVDRLVALRREHPTLALLVDDAEQLSGTPAEPVATEIARLVGREHGFVVAAATVREALEHPRGLAGSLAATGCGLLLGRADPGGGRALGVRQLVPHDGSAGRAHLVRDGAAEVVQLAR